jgi:phosphoribosylanthranilate isomerase
VKICGLTRREDADAAAGAGADYLGVIASPGFSRSVAPADAARFLEGLDVHRVAVTVDEDAAETARIAREVEATVVQLHGSEDRRAVEDLRQRGGWTVWKAVRARSVVDLERVVASLHDVVDGFVVEGWRPGVVGGGGVRLEVDAPAVRTAVPPERTFVLAGGLDPGNVGDAVARFAPDVVDVSSGVEAEPGMKDASLVRAFVAAARRAAPDPGPPGSR